MTDDGSDEGGEVIFTLALGHAAGTDALDGGAEHRIAPHQKTAGAVVAFGCETQCLRVHERACDGGPPPNGWPGNGRKGIGHWSSVNVTMNAEAAKDAKKGGVS